MAKNYCLCYGLDVGVTLIGFLHLNAALYFWARVSTFEPIYMWVDTLIASCYTVRATYFFLMLNNDSDKASRVDYSDYNQYTTYGLFFCGSLICVLKYLEWGHPPVWQFVAWTLVGLFNWYHWGILSDYAALATTSKVELAEQAVFDGDDGDQTAKVGVEKDASPAVGSDASTAFLIVNKIE